MKKKAKVQNFILLLCPIVITLIGIWIFKALVDQTNALSFEDITGLQESDLYSVRDENGYTVLRENYQYLLDAEYKQYKPRKDLDKDTEVLHSFTIFDEQDNYRGQIRQYEDFIGVSTPSNSALYYTVKSSSYGLYFRTNNGPLAQPVRAVDS